MTIAGQEFRAAMGIFKRRTMAIAAVMTSKTNSVCRGIGESQFPPAARDRVYGWFVQGFAELET
jgi:hypothetical protein